MEILTLNIDEANKQPMYLQIYDQIKNKIINSEIVKNEKLPSKRALAKQLNIGIVTIENAYAQLIDEGYIISKERDGYYVIDIDNLYILSNKKELIKEDIISKVYSNDFKYSGIDSENFPYQTFYKLSKDIIDINAFELLNIHDPRGYLPLREEISKYLSNSRMVNAPADNIVISAGSEYLFQILFQILPRNYRYGIENPGYERLNNLFTSNNIDYDLINVDKNGVNVKDLYEKSVNVVCITPSHQFPLGIIMPIKTRLDIIEWANSNKDHYIIEDDYDSEFRYVGRPIPALKSLVDSQQLIYISSFSKSLASGFRTSYMILPDSLMNIFLNSSSNFLCPVSLYTQKLLYLFMNQGYFEKHINKMRRLYKEKRDILVSILEEYNEIEIIGAEAGLHFIIKIKNVNEEKLINSLLENNIKIEGLSKYYINMPKLKDGYILFGYGSIQTKKIKKEINKILEIWHKHNFITKT